MGKYLRNLGKNRVRQFAVLTMIMIILIMISFMIHAFFDKRKMEGWRASAQGKMSTVEQLVLSEVFQETSFIPPFESKVHNPLQNALLLHIGKTRSEAPSHQYFMCNDKDRTALSEFFMANQGRMGVYTRIEKRLKAEARKYCV
ncbi:hypothetical protein [Neptuniibacter sp. QD37_11]|uniref:hypothetical protein n=1 Tax=Neptuniibacter sp. QD37_11 TaxID=3398209 RepID=UPI0039F6356B